MYVSLFIKINLVPLVFFQINISYYMHAHILASLRRVTDLLPLTIHWNFDSLMHCFTSVWNGIRRSDTRTAIVKHAQNYGNDGWGF
uniref:Secreted protein n=1 Tax=Heterorhabditis bacteriophora TaxID=37862 RepID=A0A1I7WUU4_HETBA